MDTSSSAVVDAVSSRKGPLKRQYRSPELKRQIVEKTWVPGASVARVARAHGVNACAPQKRCALGSRLHAAHLSSRYS